MMQLTVLHDGRRRHSVTLSMEMSTGLSVAEMQNAELSTRNASNVPTVTDEMDERFMHLSI